MTADHAEIKRTVRDYIIQEFLYGEEPDSLNDETQLVTGGILDSIATVKMVSFLEDTYGIRFKPQEMDAEHLDTLDRIASLVESKRASS